MSSIVTTVELSQAPGDVVSAVQFSPQHHQLLVGSWDQGIRLYDTNPVVLEHSTRPLLSVQAQSPVTSVCWDPTGRRALFGDTSGSIQELDPENSKPVSLGWSKHELGIQSLCSMDENLIVSGSWDKSVHYTDHRSNKLVQKVSLPGKVFAMDTTDQFIVVGMSERQVHVYDSRNLSVPFQVRESGLRYQTRDLKCMPNGEGYAQSSIEGRVAIEYFDPDPQVQSKKYAFKCHRLVASDADLVSPVNALTFHTKYGTLFTAGSDCHVCLWDHVSKKRLRQYSKFDQSVVSMDFDHKNGFNMLAIATSDDSYKTFATSNIQPEPVQSHLYLRLLGDSEGIPKSMKST